MSTDPNNELTTTNSLMVLRELSSLVLSPDFSSSTRETCELAYSEAKDGSGIASMVSIINGTSIAPDCYKMHSIYTILEHNPTFIKLPYNDFIDNTGLDSDKVSENYHTDIIRTYKLLGYIKDANLRNTYRDLNVATVIEFYALRKREDLDSILGDFLKESNISSPVAIEFKRKRGYIKSRSKKIDVSNGEDKKEDLPNNEDKSSNREDDGDGGNTDSDDTNSGNTVGSTNIEPTTIKASATVGEILGGNILLTPPVTIDLDSGNEDKPEDGSDEDDKDNGYDKSGANEGAGVGNKDDKDDAGNGDSDNVDKTEQVTKVDIDMISSAIVGMGIEDLIAVLDACKLNVIGIHDSIDKENKSNYSCITSMNSAITLFKHIDNKGKLVGIIDKLMNFMTEVEKRPNIIKK